MGEPENLISSGDLAVAASPLPARGPKNKRVLLVEEDPLRRVMVLNKLRLDGFDVDVAANPLVALEKVPGGELSAILLDLTNSDSSGIELIKAARRDPEFAKRPIYISTDAPLTSSRISD